MNEQQFNQLKTEMMEHVEQTIRVTVNGKIDKLQREITDMSTTLTDHITMFSPILSQFQKFSVGKQIVFSFFTFLAWAAGFIIAAGGAWYILKEFIMKLIVK